MEMKGLRELEGLDRGSLARKMQESLPYMREELGIGLETISEMSGIDFEALKGMEDRKQDMSWGNFLALLFIFWGSEKSREMIEEKGLFPEELKKALSVNRNMHI